MKAIRLYTVRGVSSVFVNGQIVFEGGRIDAKREANRIAKESGTTWENIKANGQAVIISPK